MKKYEVWERVNGGEWDQSSDMEPFEAENEKEALAMYIDSIADDLRAVDAERVDIEYPHSATFQYVNEAGTGITTIEFKVTEVED